MHDFTQENGLDWKPCERGFGGWDHEALRSFGKKAAAFLCRPEQCHHGKPRDVFVIQLHGARAEWHRRHGKHDK